MSVPPVSYRLPSGRILVLQGAGGGQEQRDPDQPRVEAPAPTGAKPAEVGKATRKGTAPAGGQPKPRQDPFAGCQQTLLLFVPFLILMYFLMIRPQQKQEKTRKKMLAEVKKGDQIVTSGGIWGQIAALDERTVTIKFGSGEGSRMKVDRSAIGRVVPRGGETKEGS